MDLAVGFRGWASEETADSRKVADSSREYDRVKSRCGLRRGITRAVANIPRRLSLSAAETNPFKIVRQLQVLNEPEKPEHLFTREAAFLLERVEFASLLLGAPLFGPTVVAAALNFSARGTFPLRRALPGIDINPVLRTMGR